jgi:glycosyltransferase involved in cell wall biosynthesis
MKILIRQFLGKNHSWSITGWGLASAFIKQGHDVHLFSTDGIKYLPKHLLPNLIGYVEENKFDKVFGRNPDKEYGSQISFTSIKNFPYYLSNGNKNRFGIWSYEWAGKNVLPNGFAKNYKACDVLCTHSNFAKQVFLDSGIPEENIKVIPLGINIENYQKTSTIKPLTNKKFKILANIAQNHLRKNIPGLLDAYGKAFTNKDDVCLILKAKEKPLLNQFDVSLNACLKKFYDKYPKHAEIKILSEFIDDVTELYRSVDATFTMTHSEAFYYPAIESRASGKLSIAPAWSGQLDLLNETNSLLISGKEVRADPKSMYWESKNNAIWFEPSIDDAVDKLRFAYENYEKLNEQIDKQRPDVYTKYSWGTIASQFLELCK